MPSDKFQEVELHCGLLNKYEFEIYDLETQLPVSIGMADDVLCKIAKTRAAAPTLDLTSDDYDGGSGVPTVSSVQITNRGSVGNLDPDDDTPARGVVWILEADTDGIPTTDAWAANLAEKRYWMQLIHAKSAGPRSLFGEGFVKLKRALGGN